MLDLGLLTVYHIVFPLETLLVYDLGSWERKGERDTCPNPLGLYPLLHPIAPLSVYDLELLVSSQIQHHVVSIHIECADVSMRFLSFFRIVRV